MANRYQEKVDNEVSNIYNKIQTLKDTIQNLENEVQKQLELEITTQTEEICKNTLKVLEESNTSLSDIQKMSLNLTIRDDSREIENILNEVFNKTKEVIVNSQSQLQSSPDANILDNFSSEFLQLADNFLDSTLKNTFQQSIQQSLVVVNECVNQIPVAQRRPVNIKFTSTRSQRSKFDIKQLIESLNKYEDDFKHVQQQVLDRTFQVDIDLLSPAHKALRQVDNINEDIKKIREQANKFNNEDSDELEIIDYIEGLKKLATLAKSKIDDSLRRVDDFNLRNQFSDTIMGLDQILSGELDSIVHQLEENGTEEISQEIRNKVGLINNTAQHIFNLSYDSIREAAHAIDVSIGLDDTRTLDSIKIQNRQRKSKLYEYIIDENGEMDFGPQRIFDKPLENELANQLKNLSFNTKPIDQISRQLVSDRYSEFSFSDSTRQLLFAKTTREGLNNKNRLFQNQLYQANHSLADAFKIFQQASDMKDEQLQKKSLEGIGGILSQVATEQISMIKSLNMSGGNFFRFSDSDKNIIQEYTKSIDDTIKQYNTLIDAMEKIDGNSNILKRLKQQRLELAIERENLNDIKERNFSFKKIIGEVFSSTGSVIMFFNGLSKYLLGGMTLIDYINPLKMMENIVNAVEKQGLMRANVARTDLRHGVNIDRNLENYLTYHLPQQLYQMSWGMINHERVSNFYTQLFDAVGGKPGNSPEQNRNAMVYFTQQLVPMQEMKNLSDSTIMTTLKTFYRDLRLSASDTVDKLKDMEKMALLNNISMDDYVNKASGLASAYRNMGLSEIRAINIFNALMKDRNLLLEDAVSLTQTIGNAVASWSLASQTTWSKNFFYDTLISDRDMSQAIGSSLISVDRFGKTNDAYYDVMFDRLWAQVTLYGGFDTNRGLSLFAAGLQENGFNPKDVSIAMSMASEGRIEELRVKLKGIAQYNNTPTSKITSDYVEALTGAANQVSEANKFEATYQSFIYKAGYILHNKFGKYIQKFVDNTVDIVSRMLKKVYNLFSQFKNSQVGQMIGDFIEKHPILSLLSGVALTKLGMFGAWGLLKKIALLPKNLLINTPTQSNRGIVKGIINAFDGVSANKKAAIISAVMAGSITLLDAIKQYAENPEKYPLEDLTTLLKSGNAKVQIINQDDDSSTETVVKFVGSGLIMLYALKGRKPGSPSTNRGILNGVRSFFGKFQRSTKQQRRQLAEQYRKQASGLNNDIMSWRRAFDILKTNTLFNVGLEGMHSAATGEDFSIVDVAQNTAMTSAFQTAGVSIFRGAASGIAKVAKMQNPRGMIDTAGNIGGTVGIFGSMVPSVIDMTSSQANANPLETNETNEDNVNTNAIDVNEIINKSQEASALDYVLNISNNIPRQSQTQKTNNSQIDKSLNESNRPKSSDDKKEPQLDDEETQKIISKSVGIDNRKSEIVASQIGMQLQTMQYEQETERTQLSNKEFSQKISHVLKDHNIEWEKLNNKQQKHWYDKYQEFNKFYNDNTKAMLQVAQSIQNNQPIIIERPTESHSKSSKNSGKSVFKHDLDIESWVRGLALVESSGGKTNHTGTRYGLMNWNDVLKKTNNSNMPHTYENEEKVIRDWAKYLANKYDNDPTTMYLAHFRGEGGVQEWINGSSTYTTKNKEQIPWDQSPSGENNPSPMEYLKRTQYDQLVEQGNAGELNKQSAQQNIGMDISSLISNTPVKKSSSPEQSSVTRSVIQTSNTVTGKPGAIKSNQVDGTGTPIEYTQLSNGRLVPYYYQAWDEKPFRRSGTNDGPLPSQSACGPTTIAMMMSTVTGNMITPRQVMDWMSDSGLYRNGFNIDTVMPHLKSKFGVGFKEVSMAEAKEALKQGIPVAVGNATNNNMKAGPSSPGHWFMYAGLREDGSVILHDPGGYKQHDRMFQKMPDSDIWDPSYSFYIPDTMSGQSISVDGTINSSSGSNNVMKFNVQSSPKSLKEQQEQVSKMMLQAGQQSGKGIIAKGALVDNMKVDSHQKNVTQEEKRKQILDKYGISIKGQQELAKQIHKDTRAKLDQEIDKIEEVKHAVTVKPDLIPKKHFKEVIKIIKSIAEKYMDEVEIFANCNIN